MSYKQHARFWSKVDVKSEGSCWEWLGAKNEDGYGCIKWPNGKRSSKIEKAHRVALALAGEDVRSDLIVMHHCDNPSCVNPAHLKLGTMKDNAVDMVQKGRSFFQINPDKVPHGEKHKSSKLTEEDVLEIYNMRKSFSPVKIIAMKKNTSESNVWAVLQGRSWRKLWVKHYK